MKELDFLKKAKLLKRPVVNTKGKDLTLGQLFHFCFLNNKEYSSFEFYGQDVHAESVLYKYKYKTFILNLVNSLPVPTEDVRLSDILEFKLKRKDEFEAFKNLLLDFKTAIIKGSSEEDIKKKLLEFEKSIKTIDRTMGEFKIKKSFTTRRIEIKVPEPEKFFLEISVNVAFNYLITGHLSLVSLTPTIIMSFLDISKETVSYEISNPYKYVYDVREHFKII